MGSKGKRALERNIGCKGSSRPIGGCGIDEPLQSFLPFFECEQRLGVGIEQAGGGLPGSRGIQLRRRQNRQCLIKLPQVRACAGHDDTQFVGIVAGLTAFDLGFLHKEDKEMGIAESLKLSAFYISIALAFGVWVYFQKTAALGDAAGTELTVAYYTAFFIEKALSINDVPVVVEFVVHKDAMVWPMVAAGTSNDEIKVARDMAPVWEGEEL